MAAEQVEGKSNLILIKQFFLDGVGASDALKEIRALSEFDKEQLGEGIRNGTLTY